MAFAQNGSITGTVTDAETGDIVPTANVILLPIQRGDAADVETGEYLIENVPTGTYTLRVTFVGYQPYEAEITIQANQELTHDVELQQGQIGLDELVVTGYGVESKRELTGSIAKVSSDEFEDVPTQTVDGILQGRAAGVQITTQSGLAGASFEVDIRGDGSINAGDDPLYIVDGVQISFNDNPSDSDSPLNNINPKDIESIEVLKDAAAASIYGAQAANGVILITTKRGVEGDTQISASVQRGTRSYIENVDYMNTQQWIEWQRLAHQVRGESQADADALIRSRLPSWGHAADTPFSELPDTDWFDFISRPGDTQIYDMSISGGNEDTRFYISGSYQFTQQQVKASDYERYNLRTNIDHTVSDKLSTRVNLSLSNTQTSGLAEDNFWLNGEITGVAFLLPIGYPYNDDGSYNTNFPGYGQLVNPAVVTHEDKDARSSVQIIGDISATYNFTSWLSLRTQFGMDWRNARNWGYQNIIARPDLGGAMSESVDTNVNFTTNTVLNFRQTFDEVHNFSGLLGGEYRRDYNRDVGASALGFSTPIFQVLSAGANPSNVFGGYDEYRVAGYFGNLKYNYDNRYFLNVTARYDGSSRFGAENRWGFFPSAGASWAVSEEEFFDVDMIDDLKLRASYGVTGNSQIGNYAALGLYELQGTYNGQTGIEPDQLANTILTWEESSSFNIGVDYSLWAGRFSGSVDVYQRDNTQLLLNTPLPSSSSFGSITRNIGHVQNRGIEFEFNSVNVDAGDFVWSSNFNIALVEDEIIELSEGVDALSPGGTLPFEVGRSQTSLNMVRWAGVNPADGRPMWYDENGDITYFPTESDEVEFGEDATSDVTGGLGNRFSYRGVTLDVFFQFAMGGYASPQFVYFYGMAAAASSEALPIVDLLTDSWRQPGDVTHIPSALPLGQSTHVGTDGWSTFSDGFMWSTDYVRLKSATLSYNLPTSLVDRIGLGNVRLYVTGLNLLTFTNYPGWDPEAPGTFTAGSTPTARQINGGIEVQF